MASMISGDFAEAYVRKNACKKETGMAEANAAAVDGSSAAQGEKKAGDGASGKKTTTGEAGVKGDGVLFGLIKKKVHPKAGGRGASSSSS
ncbi:hypothetical protein SETIT_7G122000v2 [Setaria italica]|uniref:Uncharacterized protein n=1 Tax=Setaria italica TaxID=4555 RepID=K3YB71_SETIT|nr:hypothetical protein SETIT_7G122000v2 [Setaria italica]